MITPQVTQFCSYVASANENVKKEESGEINLTNIFTRETHLINAMQTLVYGADRSQPQRVRAAGK